MDFFVDKQVLPFSSLQSTQKNQFVALLQQQHLLGLHKLSSTNLVEVDSSTYGLAEGISSIPLN